MEPPRTWQWPSRRGRRGQAEWSRSNGSSHRPREFGPVCKVPLAAVTSFRKLSSFQRYKFFSRRLEVRSPKIKFLAAFLLVALADNPFACLFQLPGVAGSSGLAAPPWCPSDLGLVSSVSVTALSSPTLMLPPPPTGALVTALGPLDNSRSSPHLRASNLITPAKSLLPCEVTYSRVLGIGVQPFWGPTTSPQRPGRRPPWGKALLGERQRAWI